MRLPDLNSGNTWQIGTGDGSRSYMPLFFDLGIACLGPGDSGPWGTPEAQLFFQNDPSGLAKVENLSKIKLGQWIIARKGLSVILGVGEVIGTMQWSSLLDDVDGWDLQHYVTVKWYRPKNEKGRIELSSRALPQSTISGCNKAKVYAAIADVEFEYVEPVAPLAHLSDSKLLPIKAIGPALLDRGIRVQDADTVVSTIERTQRLTSWYRSNDPGVLEDEIRSFLVIPLLVALGWSEQRIKLEYAAIDISLFSERFSRRGASCPEWIIEVKTFHDGLAFTSNQLQRYAQNFQNCQKFVATNGYRYVSYKRNGTALIQTGYFNLLNFRDMNSLHPNVLTPIDTMLALSRFQ